MMKTQSQPRSFRTNADGSLVCDHRDLSCCDACVAKHAPHIVDVYGRHFWFESDAELGEFAQELPQGGTLNDVAKLAREFNTKDPSDPWKAPYTKKNSVLAAMDYTGFTGTRDDVAREAFGTNYDGLAS